MKNLSSLILLSIVAIGVSCSTEKQKNTEQDTGNTEEKIAINYVKQDLKKISWIEGNWRGIYEGKYFYELYRFSNDSTLEIISYEWNGQDSSRTSKSHVWWVDNAYYLGDKKNWRVTEISETSIYMLPKNKSSNDILWRFKDNNNWDAILKAPTKENVYLMERVKTF